MMRRILFGLALVIACVAPSVAQTPELSMGGVTTGAPAYTTGTNRPLSLDTLGNLRTNTQSGPGAPGVANGGTTLFYDAFETGFDTTAKWNAPTSAGGGVGEAWSTGQITLGSGTTANGYSYVQSQYAFPPVPPGWNQFEFAIKVPAAIPANSYAYWGIGSSPGGPTAAAPITDGCGFEVQTTGKMFAACYASGSRNVIQDLSTSGNSKQPTDGATHIYFFFFRGENFFWAIDTVTNIVASQATGVNGPDVNTQPLKIQAVAGAVAPASSLTITVAGTWVGDTARNGVSIADGVSQWRKATVKAASTAPVATDQPLVVGIHPTGNIVTTGASSLATAGIVPVVSTAAEGSHAIKSGQGNLYGIEITTGASAGLLMVFDAVSAPVDGAVTPIYCKNVAATASTEMSWPVPAGFATGLVVVFSTGTNCFNKAISATAFFSVQAK